MCIDKLTRDTKLHRGRQLEQLLSENNVANFAIKNINVDNFYQYDGKNGIEIAVNLMPTLDNCKLNTCESCILKIRVSLFCEKEKLRTPQVEIRLYKKSSKLRRFFAGIENDKEYIFALRNDAKRIVDQIILDITDKVMDKMQKR